LLIIVGCNPYVCSRAEFSGTGFTGKGIKKLPLQEQLHILYKEILWILKLYGSPIKQGETPYSYARRVDEWMVNQAGSMMDVSSILISWL
jgi:hypothetical protein